MTAKRREVVKDSALMAELLAVVGQYLPQEERAGA